MWSLIPRERSHDLRDGASDPNVMLLGGPYDGQAVAVNFVAVVLERRAADGHVHRYVPDQRERTCEVGHRQLRVFHWDGPVSGR
jgi:hypothetical protein